MKPLRISVWTSLCFSILLLFPAIWLHRRYNYDPTAVVKQVVKSLARLEHSYRPLPQRSRGPQVIVGFGACVDLRVRAIPLLQLLGFEPPKLSVEQLRTYDHSGVLNTEDDISLSFSSGFVSGAAVERPVLNKTLFRRMVQVAANLIPPELQTRFVSTLVSGVNMLRLEGDEDVNNTAPLAWWSLGGSAPMMAVRLAAEGAEVSLAARLSDRERGHLPHCIKTLIAPPQFGLPAVPEEDIHLILEYESGERWGDLVAPRANRYILVHDEELPRLSGLWPGVLDTWQRVKSAFDSTSASSDDKSPIGTTHLSTLPIPDLVVIGGLQSMDRWPFPDQPDIRSDRLTELKNFLALLSPETPVHFEMASYVNRQFANEMLRKIMPFVDSLGMNEQELPNLASLLSDGPVSSISSAYPRAAHMLDSMRTVWALMNDPQLPRVASASGPGWRRLSRIHLHTLGYQMIMVRRHVHGGQVARRDLDAALNAGSLPARRSDVGLLWPFTRAAAAKASLIAHRHTCAASAIDPVKTRLLMDDSFAVTADANRWRSALRGSSVQDPIPRIHFNASSPVTCWTEPEPSLEHLEDFRRSTDHSDNGRKFNTHVEICVAPVPVCIKVRQTVAAGDNISAGALRAQITARNPSSR
ncbi:putative ADP-dependent glucokinase [Fasciola hepatica]|uniref:ADP-dependent glucokinase n=1 Tax=Fasciola hepatica TaxID=6192 RepID=A0A4E0R8V5_FASHE|nr:putative ADP-dependent glucokinase [Fasciola hepatica]